MEGGEGASVEAEEAGVEEVVGQGKEERCVGGRCVEGAHRAAVGCVVVRVRATVGKHCVCEQCEQCASSRAGLIGQEAVG